MNYRNLSIVGILGLVVGVFGVPQVASALMITDPFGFSSFSAIVGDHTIDVTETIDSAVTGFTINFESAEEQSAPWQVTKTITNETGTDWDNFDNELQVPDGHGGFMASSDFDGTSFNQGNPHRLIHSDTFFDVFIDELAARDFIQFQDGPLDDGETDIQTFPITSFSLSTIRLQQTPNFRNPEPVVPEPASLILMGLGGIAAGFSRRRARAKSL